MAKYQIASYMMLCKNNDFASKFLIPAKFVKKYREIAGIVSVTLETDSGKSWDVNIKRVNEDLYMKDGWSEFAIDNDLTEHDGLTFRWLRRSSSFKVSIYGANCCLKHPISPTPTGSEHENTSNEGSKRGRGRPRKFDNGSGHENATNEGIKRGRGRPRCGHENSSKGVEGIKRGRGRPPRNFDIGTNANKKSQSSKAAKLPYMEMHLKPHHRSRVALRKEFWNAGGMRKKKFVAMEYAGTRDRKYVELDHRRWRTELTQGWLEFRKANGIVLGKIYSFEFNTKESVIRVDEVK